MTLNLEDLQKFTEYTEDQCAVLDAEQLLNSPAIFYHEIKPDGYWYIRPENATAREIMRRLKQWEEAHPDFRRTL